MFEITVPYYSGPTKIKLACRIIDGVEAASGAESDQKRLGGGQGQPSGTLDAQAPRPKAGVAAGAPEQVKRAVHLSACRRAAHR